MNQRGKWQLILMAREGDRHAIDELFYSSFRPAYLILSAFTGDKQASLDILAEGYVQIFQHLDTLETGDGFDEALNRYTIDRARALFPSREYLRLADESRVFAADFRHDPPQLHDFDTLPAMNLSARADEILAIMHALPVPQQVCAYLYYYIDLAPETIADILRTAPDTICGTLQQVRQSIVPQIDSVLKKSIAFRGTDAESAILWALRCTQTNVPAAGETEVYYQSLIEKLVACGFLEASSAEEEEPIIDEIPMQDIAPPKEHKLLHAIFSLRTLIIVLSVLVVVGLFVGVRQLHKYNERRNRIHTASERTTLSLLATAFPSEHYIFSTEFEAPTEPEATTEEVTVTETEVPTETTATTLPTETERTEPTSPVITTTKPYADLQRSVHGNAITITGYTGSSNSPVIPDKLDGKTVTAIGENAFANSNISSIRLPNTITSIGKNAFRNCSSLQNIALPSGVTTIEADAFHGCSALRTVVLPSSLKQLGSQAFYACYSLTGAALPASLTTMGNSVFYDCKSLSRCTFDANPRLNALGDATFFNCTSLESFTVPASVKAIPSNCFSGCRSLESVSMPASLTNIGQNAFLDCTLLSSVKFGSGLRKIEASAFSGCRSLDEVTLPSGTTGIGASAFSGCTGLRMITIPASVTNIGTKAFDGCRNLVIDCPKGSVAEQYAVRNHIELANSSDVTYNDDTNSE